MLLVLAIASHTTRASHWAELTATAAANGKRAPAPMDARGSCGTWGYVRPKHGRSAGMSVAGIANRPYLKATIASSKPADAVQH